MVMISGKKDYAFRTWGAFLPRFCWCAAWAGNLREKEIVCWGRRRLWRKKKSGCSWYAEQPSRVCARVIHQHNHTQHSFCLQEETPRKLQSTVDRWGCDTRMRGASDSRLKFSWRVEIYLWFERRRRDCWCVGLLEFWDSRWLGIWVTNVSSILGLMRIGKSGRGKVPQ